jgi:hypothetical protein
MEKMSQQKGKRGKNDGQIQKNIFGSFGFRPHFVYFSQAYSQRSNSRADYQFCNP